MLTSASIDTNEIRRFSSHAQDWWDPDGVWSPLHKLNPVRIDYIVNKAATHFGVSGPKSLEGLSVLDIGCGGGLASEPLARFGAKVTGLDASEKAIAAARDHAKKSRLKITYINGSVEAFARGKQKFDIIIGLEILEHVADMGALLSSVSLLLKPNGLFIVSTVNRTMKSYLLGIVAAEYILGWVPSGMHDWNKFVRPSELAGNLSKAGLTLMDLTGMIYNPLRDNFSLRQGRVDLNYLATAQKKE